MPRYQVTVHDHRDEHGDKPMMTVVDAASVTCASDDIWAAIPRAERHHYSVSIERADRLDRSLGDSTGGR